MGAFKTKGFINHVYVTTIFWKFLVLLGFSLGEGVKYHAVTGKIINSEHAHRKITFSLNVKPCSYFVRMRLWYEFEYHNSVTNNCRQLTCDQPLRNFRCENTKHPCDVKVHISFAWRWTGLHEGQDMRTQRGKFHPYLSNDVIFSKKKSFNVQ